MRRPTTVVDTLVIHATVESSLTGSIDILRERGNSYHYLIDRDGTTVQCVSPREAAFHAGKSMGPQGEGVNEYSLSISMVNLNDGSDPFTTVQIETAQALVKRLKASFPELRFVTTHAAISPNRKDDPKGFPIQEFAEATGLTLWL